MPYPNTCEWTGHRELLRLRAMNTYMTALSLGCLLTGGLSAQHFDILRLTMAPSFPLDPTSTWQVADLNGDGNLDLVGARRGAHTLGRNILLFGRGDGTFTDVSASHWGAGWETMELAVGDVDGDGDLDVYEANVNARDRLYVNAGKGKLTDAVQLLPLDSSNTYCVRLADLDGDQRLDVIVGKNDGLRLYLGQQSGRFTDASQRLPASSARINDIALLDIDGDRDLDVFAATQGAGPLLYRNDGPSGFVNVSNTLPSGSSFSLRARSADLNRDGKTDVLLLEGSWNASSALSWYRGDGAGGFSRVPIAASLREPGNPTLLDLDSDGDLDVFVPQGRNYGTQNLYLRNDGAGSFVDASQTVLPAETLRVRAALPGDFDRDGDEDLVLASSSSPDTQPLRVYLGDGNGRLQPTTHLRIPPLHSKIETGALVDSNGDGHPDLLSFANGTGDLQIIFNDGNGFFGSRIGPLVPFPAAPSNPSASHVETLDANRDGHEDLLWVTHFWQGRYRLLIGNGKGGYTDESVVRLPQVTQASGSCVIADFDLDGDVDILTEYDTGLGFTPLLLNDGLGNFIESSFGRYPNTVLKPLHGVDVDGDGDVDLVGSGALGPRVLVNDGQARFTDQTPTRILPTRTRATQMTLLDLDVDGDMDLFILDAQRKPLYYKNDGRGVFTLSTWSGPDLFGHYSIIVDVDGKNGLDVIAADPLARTHSYWRNDGSGKFQDASHLLAQDDWVPRARLATDIDGDGDSDLVFCQPSSQWGLVPFVNRLRQLHGGVVARLGRPFELHWSCRPGEADGRDLVIPMLSSRRLAQPVRIPGFGNWHLDFAGLLMLPPVPLGKSGTATLQLPIPADPNLARLELHFQGLFYQANTQQLWFTSNRWSELLLP
jgi:hypothetical protein